MVNLPNLTRPGDTVADRDLLQKGTGLYLHVWRIIMHEPHLLRIQVLQGMLSRTSGRAGKLDPELNNIERDRIYSRLVSSFCCGIDQVLSFEHLVPAA